MDELLRRLKEVMGQTQQPAAPAPVPATPAEPAINEARPWDSPVLRQQMPPALGGAPGLVQTNPSGPVTPSDDALLQALLKQRVNQEFARAGNQPIPR